MATSTNWSGLTEYVDVNREKLITQASTDAKSIRYFDLALNVKYKSEYPILTSEVVLQDASSCGWNPQGSDEYGALLLETFAVGVQKEWCGKDLEKSFANYDLLWQANKTSMPYEEHLISNNMGRISEALETAVWSGITSVGMPGILAQLDDASAVTIDAETTSADTISQKIDKVVAKIPTNAFKVGKEGKANVFVSESLFRNYIQEMNSSCCQNIGLQDAAQEDMVYKGDSRVIIVPVPGLEGSDKVIATPAEGFIYATDLLGSESEYSAFWDRKEKKLLFDVEFRSGTGVKYPFYTVIG